MDKNKSTKMVTHSVLVRPTAQKNNRGDIADVITVYSRRSERKIEAVYLL